LVAFWVLIINASTSPIWGTKIQSNKEIATTLFVAESTVKTHVASIYGKLKAIDRTEAVVRAIQGEYPNESKTDYCSIKQSEIVLDQLSAAGNTVDPGEHTRVGRRVDDQIDGRERLAAAGATQIAVADAAAFRKDRGLNDRRTG